MTIGQRIQTLRRQYNMSQEQLAEKILVRRQAVSKWELSESLPDVDNIVRLSEVFGVSTDYLLKDDAPRSVWTEYPPAPSHSKASPAPRLSHMPSLLRTPLLLGFAGMMSAGIGLVHRTTANVLFPISGAAILIGLAVVFIMPIVGIMNHVDSVKFRLGKTMVDIAISTLMVSGMFFNRLHALIILPYAATIAWLGLAIVAYSTIRQIVNRFYNSPNSPKSPIS